MAVCVAVFGLDDIGDIRGTQDKNEREEIETNRRWGSQQEAVCCKTWKVCTVCTVLCKLDQLQRRLSVTNRMRGRGGGETDKRICTPMQPPPARGMGSQRLSVLDRSADQRNLTSVAGHMRPFGCRTCLKKRGGEEKERERESMGSPPCFAMLCHALLSLVINWINTAYLRRSTKLFTTLHSEGQAISPQQPPHFPRARMEHMEDDCEVPQREETPSYPMATCTPDLEFPGTNNIEDSVFSWRTPADRFFLDSISWFPRIVNPSLSFGFPPSCIAPFISKGTEYSCDLSKCT